MRTRFIFLIVMSFLSGLAAAQTTGSFITNISFMGQSRQLSVYVPVNYNAANKYKLMICLHGLGDNSANYRNSLITSLGWDKSFPATIFICPEAAAVNSDFYGPAGDEEVIQKSIDYAMSHYHIDTMDVSLQGFSLGGRAALRYGLDHPALFKGLYLNTPAVQGVKEALNLTSYRFNYTNAAGMPVYMTHGATDYLYTGVVDTTYRQLLLNNAKVKLVRVDGLGHQIPAMSQMPGFTTYFSDPYLAPYDLDMVQLILPDRTCQASVAPECLVRNTGSAVITAAKIHYASGATAGDYTWSGTLAPFEHTTITLPQITPTTGVQTVSASVVSLNTGLTDSITANNLATGTMEYASAGMALPIKEGFESTTFPPAGWLVRGSGESYSAFELDDLVRHTGSGSMFAFNTALLFDNIGRKEELLSPVVDLSSISSPLVSFDVAYNYHHYTASVLGVDTTFADTLDVSVSVDCGASFQTVYHKGGAQLATFTHPIANPLSLDDCFATPADRNWRRESVSVQQFAASNSAIIKFSYKSALGGSLNIDNISIGNLATGIASKMAKDNFKLFPNPANQSVSIITEQEKVLKVDISDVSGRQVYNKTTDGLAGGRIDLDLSSLNTGVYFVRIYTADSIQTQQLLIRR
jgi:pimeloyl-ACP methyl ester carboxylesterase